MERAYFYSDESKDGSRFVVAGVTISAHANVIKAKLLRAEKESGKGARDWQKTKDPKVRRRYIEAVLNIPQLDGCGFRCVYPATVNPFEATVAALDRAMVQFGAGKRCVLVHEGFSRGTREKMKAWLSRERPAGQVSVEAGRLENEPRVRLADALAGFCRVMGSDSVHRDALEGLPYDGWFVDLEGGPQ